MSLSRAAVYMVLIGVVLSVIAAAKYAKAQSDNHSLGTFSGDWLYYGGTIALVLGTILTYKKLSA